jgi:spermidine synthase
LLLQILVSAVIVLVPAMIMGSTLPLIAGFVTKLGRNVGRLVGRLYALNTLGAALGCFLAGFILIRIGGILGALLVAAAINLVVAVAGWLLSRRYEAGPSRIPQITQDSAPAGRESAAEPDHPQSLWVQRGAPVLLLAFFMSGLISIGYELIWMRAIVIPIGGYTYVFSAVLTVYLLGNFAGAAVGSRLASRVANPPMVFGLSLSVLGLFGLILGPWLVTWLSGAGPVLARSGPHSGDGIRERSLQAPALRPRCSGSATGSSRRRGAGREGAGGL